MSCLDLIDHLPAAAAAAVVSFAGVMMSLLLLLSMFRARVNRKSSTATLSVRSVRRHCLVTVGLRRTSTLTHAFAFLSRGRWKPLRWPIRRSGLPHKVVLKAKRSLDQKNRSNLFVRAVASRQHQSRRRKCLLSSRHADDRRRGKDAVTAVRPIITLMLFSPHLSMRA